MLRTPPPHSLSAITFLPFTSKPLFPKTLNLFRLSTSAATTATAAVETLPSPSPQPHPWPEWVSFVDCLTTRGYFPSTAGTAEAYREMKLLKEPCLSFARDRYDIFKSVSRDDIRSIVEVGCPKINRKVVNSAKRLRGYLGLEEKDVCDSCILKGSCDRAYLIPNDGEEARTVDVMRLLLFYALDPTVISGALRPPGIEQAESSARRLLSMLMELSEASTAPHPVESSHKNEKSVRPAKISLSQDVERKNGDWVCPKCSFKNFARNNECRKCNEGCPDQKRERAQFQPKAGDWFCSECNFLNFARNVRCRQCDADCHNKRESSQVELKTGDWNCSECGFTNFARRTTCFRCTGTRPQHTLNQGEWVCTKCDFLNFRRNATCLKCSSDHFKETVPEQEHTWRKPATFTAD